MIELKVPDIGADAVPIIELHVKEGDLIAIDDALITLESDKASMDVPSTHHGVIKNLLIKIGDKVSQDQVIAILEPSAQNNTTTHQAANLAADIIKNAQQATLPAASIAAPTSVQASPIPAAATTNQKITNTADNKNNTTTSTFVSHASPSVRKFARELGINNLVMVSGSGVKNRITHDDIKNFVKQTLTHGMLGNGNNSGGNNGLNVLDWPKVDFSKFGAFSKQPLSRIQKISGANLHRNWVMIPHVTNHDEADITNLEALRVQLNQEYTKQNIKITMLAFLIKASVAALKKFPIFNASLDGDDIVLKEYYHIGFAADTPNGLVVPVIKNADSKGIIEIAQETSVLAGLAREGKLKPDQMQGGCFSISSLGGIGGTSFTPIINAPEVAILGVCKAYQKPIWNENKQVFEPRLTLPLSLSWDHRVIDGAVAARFNVYIAQLLADFRRIIL
jgi:pyruvate dehydrogenase E2 component (dihydrolipoamide acetyltransferase)